MKAKTPKIDQNISNNFNIAKVLSILSVISGHYFKEFTFLWVPATIGLLIFSYSSGFFTWLKYNGCYNKKAFWTKKVERLGFSLVIINIFLLILFLIQGKPGIITWQTAVNMLGLSGFLNWFNIQNISPFGAGMWFFTLLLIFYLSYPGIEYLNRKKSVSYLFGIFFVFLSYYLHVHIVYGHALWLTACGFVVGVFFARNEFRIPGRLSVLMLGVILSVMLYFNYLLGIKSYNFFFFLFLGILCIFSLKDCRFPDFLLRTESLFSGCLLEIYLIHSYLFIKPTGYRFFDFTISLFIILSTAKILQMITFLVKTRLKIWKLVA